MSQLAAGIPIGNALGSVFSVDGKIGNVDLSGDYAAIDHTHSQADIISFLGYTPEDTVKKGIANGYASLDAGALLPLAQIPDIPGARITQDATHRFVADSDISNWNGKADDSAVVHNTGAEVVGGEKTFSDELRVNAFFGVGVDPERSLHVRGDGMRFDRDAPAGLPAAPFIFISGFDENYTAVRKTFGLEISTVGTNLGSFYIRDRQTTVGGATFFNRMIINSAGVAAFPYVYANNVAGGTTLYMDSFGEMGTVVSLRKAKMNIAPLSEMDLSWFEDLEFCSFNFRQKDENGNYTDNPMPCLEFGGVAEDFEAVNPDLVYYKDTEQVFDEASQDMINQPISPPLLRGIRYETLVPLMGCIIQQLLQRVTALENG